MQSVGFCVLLVCLLASQLNAKKENCTKDNRILKAKGTRVAPDCRYPYLVSIRDVFKRHICSGTLIKGNYLLTAASCVTSSSGLTAGINGIYKDGPFSNELKIIRVIRHPDFKGSNLERDVAIIELGASSDEQKIKLARRRPSAKTQVAIVGWGRIAPQGAFSEVMQHRTDYRISPSGCRSINVLSGFLCAGKDGVNICEGDHGGPLIKRGSNAASDIQVGIISKAVGDCSRNGKPGRFINVASINNWIDKQT